MGKKVLAIETSGKMFSLALTEEREGDPFLKGEIFLDAGLRHSEILKKSCELLLNECGWKKEELNLLAVSTGPGSFTGLRVGISFARTLAQFLKVPLIGIPAFEILAQGIVKERKAELICILIDSIGHELFAGLFRNSSMKPNSPYQIVRMNALKQKIKTEKKIIFAGDGFLHYRAEIKKTFGARTIEVPYEKNFPQARVLAELAILKIQRSKVRKNSWRKVVPFYLRPPIAIERLKAK